VRSGAANDATLGRSGASTTELLGLVNVAHFLKPLAQLSASETYISTDLFAI
jgi:hypothetical protein